MAKLWKHLEIRFVGRKPKCFLCRFHAVSCYKEIFIFCTKLLPFLIPFPADEGLMLSQRILPAKLLNDSKRFLLFFNTAITRLAPYSYQRWFSNSVAKVGIPTPKLIAVGFPIPFQLPIHTILFLTFVQDVCIVSI